jgi:hypothetical protein
MLVPLLGHPKQGVRYYAAKHLLAIAPERARSVNRLPQASDQLLALRG